jgi:hypothetical protein
VRYFPSEAKVQESVASRSPVGAVDFLRQHSISGPLFNSYGFGGYLIWARGPEHKVFIDGRGEVYENGGVFSDYLHITLLKPGALTVLRRYGVQTCLLSRDEPLANVLVALPEWQRIYYDQNSELFVLRSGGGTASTMLESATPATKSGVPGSRRTVGSIQAQLAR